MIRLRKPHLRGLAATVTCLAMCSCRMVAPNLNPPYQNLANCRQPRFTSAGGRGYAYGGLPMEAYTGYPGDGYTEPAVVPQFMRAPANSETVVSDDGFSDPSVLETTQRTDLPCGLDQQPLPNGSCGPWKPAGISKPWPEDEYIFDGGDSDGEVKVRRDGKLEGLDSEDTIAYYDTLAGKTCVTPSCRVCLYAPRFAAVRQVTLAYGENQLVRAGGVDMPVGPVPQLDVQPVSTALQPIQPIGEIANRSPVTFLEKLPPIGLLQRTVIRATVDRLKPYENFELIRNGQMIESEKPFLAISVQSAITWTLDQGVQVAVEGKKAVVLEGDQRAQATYTITPPDHPCLRVCKVASTHSANPGDIVEFTLRFDNVGDQTVGNVTIADNLTSAWNWCPIAASAASRRLFSPSRTKKARLYCAGKLPSRSSPAKGALRGSSA